MDVVARKLPETVGLCPVHAAEFYLADPDSRVCPEPGCHEQLMVYVPPPPEGAVEALVTAWEYQIAGKYGQATDVIEAALEVAGVDPSTAGGR